MEFFKTTLYNADINAIFTGSHYYFFSGWYGLICVAERDYTAEDGGKCKFTLYLAENRRSGGDWQAFAKVAKKIITKAENKYISRSVDYIVKFEDIERWAVEVTIKKQ